MKLSLKAFILELKYPFTISRQSFTKKPTLIVQLHKNGYVGLGEASANPYYNITIQSMINDIESIRNIIEKKTEQSPNEFWNYLYPFLKHNMFALSAIDIAFNDLYAKVNNKKLYEIWNLNHNKKPLTNYTIGIDTIDKMVLKMKEKPWPIYKIKLGTKDDIKIIKALRKHTNAIFRVDANCAWTAAETIKNAKILKHLNVEFIEQPLPANDWINQKKVYEKSFLPIIADESCLIEEDVIKCYNYFHGINIKLTKCGGLTPAIRMIKTAQELNLKTMVGCMTESSIGISAIAHLTPLLDFVDMDGALLLKNDIANGVEIIDGKILFSKYNGTGARLKDETIG